MGNLSWWKWNLLQRLRPESEKPLFKMIAGRINLNYLFINKRKSVFKWRTFVKLWKQKFWNFWNELGLIELEFNRGSYMHDKLLHPNFSHFIRKSCTTYENLILIVVFGAFVVSILVLLQMKPWLWRTNVHFFKKTSDVWRGDTYIPVTFFVILQVKNNR